MICLESFLFVARAATGEVFALYFLIYRIIFPFTCRSGRDGPLLFPEEKVGKNSVKGCRLLPPLDAAPYADWQKARAHRSREVCRLVGSRAP